MANWYDDAIAVWPCLDLDASKTLVADPVLYNGTTRDGEIVSITGVPEECPSSPTGVTLDNIGVTPNVLWDGIDLSQLIGGIITVVFWHRWVLGAGNSDGEINTTMLKINQNTTFKMERADTEADTFITWSPSSGSNDLVYQLPELFDVSAWHSYMIQQIGTSATLSIDGGAVFTDSDVAALDPDTPGAAPLIMHDVEAAITSDYQLEFSFVAIFNTIKSLPGDNPGNPLNGGFINNSLLNSGKIHK